MEIEKCRGHHVTVESAHLRDGAGGEPGGLFTRQPETVRHSGQHPTARDKGISGGDLDERTAGPDCDGDRVQWCCRVQIPMCYQAR
jgi:hypothetical protein